MTEMKLLLIFVLTIGIACASCGDPGLPPVAGSQKIDNAADAKRQARIIAGQKCRYDGYKDIGGADVGAQRFHCERGNYIFELDQSHLFEEKFFSFKADDVVVFRYSEKLLMKPQYLGNPKPNDANPAYYLEPIP